MDEHHLVFHPRQDQLKTLYFLKQKRRCPLHSYGWWNWQLNCLFNTHDVNSILYCNGSQLAKYCRPPAFQKPSSQVTEHALQKQDVPDSWRICATHTLDGLHGPLGVRGPPTGTHCFTVPEGSRIDQELQGRPHDTHSFETLPILPAPSTSATQGSCLTLPNGGADQATNMYWDGPV